MHVPAGPREWRSKESEAAACVRHARMVNLSAVNCLANARLTRQACDPAEVVFRDSMVVGCRTGLYTWLVTCPGQCKTDHKMRCKTVHIAVRYSSTSHLAASSLVAAVPAAAVPAATAGAAHLLRPRPKRLPPLQQQLLPPPPSPLRP